MADTGDVYDGRHDGGQLGHLGDLAVARDALHAKSAAHNVLFFNKFSCPVLRKGEEVPVYFSLACIFGKLKVWPVNKLDLSAYLEISTF